MNLSQHPMHSSLQLSQLWLGGNSLCSMYDYRSFEPSRTFYEYPSFWD